MVYFASFFGAATLLAGYVAALPRPDSALGQEVAVSAPNGVILSDTVELSLQLASESSVAASSSAYYPAMTTSNTYDAMTTSTAMAAYSSPTAATYTPSPVAYSSSPVYTPAATTTSAMSSTVTYGSGSTNWGGSGYDNCVQQCIASFGAPPATWTPSPTASSSSGGSGGGSGTTHTVIVAPTQGVLRYVPFAVNASIGDTIHFQWMANNHTVTKSSALELCNKTTDALFASGTHDKGFTFDQVVNDTNPIFFYCATPGHCQKGMFGMINAGSAAGSNTSVQQMMPALTANNSDLAAMQAYTNSQTQGHQLATNWGQNINLAGIPEWAHTDVMANVMYNRAFFAANPEVLAEDGTVNLSASGAPLLFPQDITSALSNAAAPTAASSAASVSATPVAASVSASTSATPTPVGAISGASSIAASSVLLAIAAIAGSFLAF